MLRLKKKEKIARQIIPRQLDLSAEIRARIAARTELSLTQDGAQSAFSIFAAVPLLCIAASSRSRSHARGYLHYGR